MPTSTITIDKITTPDISIVHSETEITLDAISLSVNIAGHHDSSRIQYIGHFLENKTQFDGKRIHHTTEHCLTYTGTFMVFADSDGNTLFKPPEEPSLAKLEKETLNDKTLSITHFGNFVNLTPFGKGIETKKIINDDDYTYTDIKQGNFIDKNIQGPYKQTVSTVATIGKNTYLRTMSCQFEKEPILDDKSIYGELEWSIFKCDRNNKKKPISFSCQKGIFASVENMVSNNSLHKLDKLDKLTFRITQGKVIETNDDPDVVTSVGTFIFNDGSVVLDNSRPPHINSYITSSINEETYKLSEGIFRKGILVTGLCLTRVNQNTDNSVSCYQGKFDQQDKMNDPDGLLCLYNYTNQKFIAFHGSVATRINTWFEIELNTSHQIISIAALTSKDSCSSCLKTTPISTGKVVINSLTFTTPTPAKILWKMHRDAFGQWTGINANSTKTPSVKPEQITLWDRLEKIAIHMKIAHPFMAQPLLEKQNPLQKESVATITAEAAVKAAVKAAAEAAVKAAVEAAAESARDLLLSEMSTKNKTSKKTQPKPKPQPSVSSKQVHSINLGAADNSEVNDIDIEISTILATSSDIILKSPKNPIHYPTPIGQEKYSPDEVRTPSMKYPTPIPIWANVTP